MRKGLGILLSSMGRPISSQASRRAIWSARWVKWACQLELWKSKGHRICTYRASLLSYLPCLLGRLRGLRRAMDSWSARRRSRWKYERERRKRSADLDGPEKLLRLAARMVSTTRRSPWRSAYSRMSTAALRLRGSLSHTGKGGGLYARRRAMAAFVLVTTILFMTGDEGLALHGKEERSGWAGGGGMCVFGLYQCAFLCPCLCLRQLLMY